jgi:methionyl-tRNA formyltransferase
MAPEIDAGEIAYQSLFAIEACDTPLSLMHKCIDAGIPLLRKLLQDASQGLHTIPSIAQDLTKRRYYGKEVPDKGWLRWSNTATNIVNFVRACDYSPYPSPWGHPRTLFNGTEMEVLKGSLTAEKCDQEPGFIGDVDVSGALVASADEWVSINLLRIGPDRFRPHEVLRRGDRLETALQV